MTMPLFIRLLEWAREDAPDDIELHKAAERCLTKGTMDMDDYQRIIGKGR